MTRFGLAALIALPCLMGGCAAARCQNADDARNACLEEAEANGVEVPDYQAGDLSCQQYDSILYNDPLFGSALTPDFGCMADAWNNATCTSTDGIAAAFSAEDACQY